MVSTSAPAPKGRGAGRSSLGRIATIAAAILVTLAFLYPVIYMVSISFKLPKDIFTVPPKWISQVTFDNYVSYFNQARILPRMINTIIVASGASIISMVAGSMAGYALSRMRMRGAGVVGGLILASRAVPPIALVVPMFLVARKMGLTDQYITVILAYVTFLVPYVVWLMRAFFKSLPKELEEAAMIDGCSRFGAFFRIIVPCSLTGMVSTLIFCIILAWEELLFALILTNDKAVTIPVAIAGIAADTEHGGLWGPLAAVGTLTVLPVVIFALAVQKYLIKGLADGATKG
ncbi:carbohydrate ABC transporter permease [Streptosporangium roseum]|uniref:Binding-protein-dependent transport systems inner membrane component n=1 Tax=Streptosporangium roseum (strain ATCC 12428 / DSM 43021 / JCM 3005 / KCTC 9067 / NCIMB 10171 / NRRL 2505 / NI 9100) TaxID=479432 RepID=D2ASG5_STRRD|nr:carbohydrate ABC transporter permease [Streptosporangium roseum]ACZ88488.1 binding-protein-dependent transport systems inner membrane component [Streptosporangium roseum DSM 43021]